MSNDNNYIVRCDAYNLLALTANNNIAILLIHHINKENHAVARMHLIAAIAKIVASGNSSLGQISTLQKEFDNEKNKQVIIAYHCLFYSLYKKVENIENALSYLNDEDYHIRCNVVNLVVASYDDLVKPLVLSSFLNQYQIDDSIAVKSLLKREIEQLQT